MADPETGEKVKFDAKSFKDAGISWLTCMMLRWWPSRGVRSLAREFGMSNNVAEEAHHLFGAVERIDIIPSRSGSRGFQIVIEGTTALYFYQDGDHFIYDGCEVGEYEKGDITVFDNVL